MNDQPYDLFGDVFRRYFTRAVDVYPHVGRRLVHQLLASSDDVQDRVAEARHAAFVWSRAESAGTGMTSECFVITQRGLMYAANFDDATHRLHYLATPAGLFDPFIDRVEDTPLQSGEIVAVDRRCSHDLEAAHPMDAALRRILDEFETLRVDVRVA
ncbi:MULTISPECIES: glucose-6-phosphate dehydrogenase [unclassified Mycolicibacterium]|uniref:glucose-6-phosphate dehydrogenase n=1 Tax=unclassified Mycolicibacterium TaxID=2636767 RepID=UPI002EDB6646